MREFTTKTLWQGWWGLVLVFIYAPRTLMLNLAAIRELAALPSPGSTAPGYASLPVGKSVRQRPLAYVAVIPAAWAVFFITGVIMINL